jgi:hypothetical protein
MAVRNCSEIGENLQNIIKRLFANQNLLKLLYYTDKDPLKGEDLTQEQIQKEVFEKLIKVVPRVGPKENVKSIVTVRVADGVPNVNSEFRNLEISIEIFVPLTQWLMKGTNLRPFAIMGEIQKSLDDKKINGLGKMHAGSFNLQFLTEEIGCYEQIYNITSYD